MAKFQDITGNRYNYLTVIRRLENAHGGVAVWECLCDCGNTTIVRGANLKSGAVKSCGCLVHRVHSTNPVGKSRLYRIWAQMKGRCENPNHSAYKNYGGRGISVCEEWHNFQNFSEWAKQNGYKENLTIERIDNNGDYCPENCKWITKGEQVQNRRMNYAITYMGKTQNLVQWCNELGIDYFLVHNRIHKLHWSFERAISTPCNINKRNMKARKEA